MMFSTSSPTYPASVSVVASAIVKGTFNRRAKVSASSVLPQVVDRHREYLLGAVLADDVLIEHLANLVRLGQLVARPVGSILQLFADDVVAQLDAFVADEYRRPRDELADLVLTLAAE
jgi:hypothetical protein